jgi:molybdopterin/thiamine biosynthesis adenylyltransferase
VDEKKRKGENRPIILGNADNHSVSWFSGDADNRLAWTAPSIQTSPALFLSLAGLLLAETVRQIMPLDVWIRSTMTLPVQIDLNPHPTQKSVSEIHNIADGTLVLLGGGALGNWFLWGFPWTDLTSRYPEIVIVDNDRVDRTNLNRQVFFSVEDIGQFKADILTERLNETLFATNVTTIPERLESATFFNERNITPDALVSALDNWHARWLLNRIALDYRIPIINGGTDFHSANVYAHWPDVTPCLDCALDLDRKRQADNNQQSCAMAEPSVVTTNMIAAGFMLHQLAHPSAHGIIQYDLSVPDRIGRLEVFGTKEDCQCHHGTPKENNEHDIRDNAVHALRDSFYLW